MRIVTLLSGGIDSSTLVYHLQQDYEVYPLFVKYGQRHSKEIESSKAIANSLNLNLKIGDISSNMFLFAGSALTDDIEVPKAGYDKKSMSLTVVNNRNMILLSLATAYAQSIKAEFVGYAAHSGDHFIYPDCRPEFIKAIGQTIDLSTEGKVNLLTPFALLTKADIVKLGLRLKVPYQLTFSCYNGGRKSCGLCGTCQERLEAFRANNVIDPIGYQK